MFRCVFVFFEDCMLSYDGTHCLSFPCLIAAPTYSFFSPQHVGEGVPMYGLCLSTSHVVCHQKYPPPPLQTRGSARDGLPGGGGGTVAK